MKRKEQLKKRIKEFAKAGDFDIHTSEHNKIMSIGLKWGESKRLKDQFKRKEQIKLLDKMEENPEYVKKLFKGLF